MKRRNLEPKLSRKKVETGLCKALLSLETVEEMRAFLRDLCTPAELEALTDRWSVVPLVLEGRTYRDIHERTAVSITTIGRVARFINQGNGGYLAAASARSTKRASSSQGVRA
ncbi:MULTISPECIES: YerC/YecD family TrpR-related protein [Oleiagrimonas]|jgi:TrpR-related protein YerC/YecD|uniref:DNA-binding transcriptional regulator n=1 Tax=Oleiagrimonas citrea TaxID=1665687 RepID=A0A846ZHS1_9GAMM|nr:MULTISPECIES: YerC/YecD family TrpR-related protein [Oleiagrimonas]NKZ37746.1 DNA-binding transcriptional regulator [Oleiagrimonas citrea]RAP56332.1 hypothetical protein BTJ49_13000 [Oleiagrimonas sp. MCCC 1A03011]